MSDATVRGRFLWHELQTTDTTSAGAFFAKITGWKLQPFDDSGSYTLFVSGENGRAGLMALPEEAKKMGAPAHWLIYIGTPNVDETARQASGLGATILEPPSDIPTVGRYAVIQDPQGAVFAVLTPSSAAQAERGAEVGEFSWHELSTTDWQRALRFYQQLFGWEETGAMDMGPMGTYQMYGRNGRTLGGMMNKPQEQPGPSAWLPYIRVSDARKAAAAVKAAGGRVIHGPAEVPGGDLIAQGLDLQGAVFAVHSVKAAAKPVAPTRTAGKGVRKVEAKKAAKKVAKKTARAPKGRATAKRKAVPVKKKRVTKKKPAAKKRATPGRKKSMSRKAPARRR